MVDKVYKGDIILKMKNTIIDNINKHLELRGIKQVWIAEMIGMEPIMLNNILNKKNKYIDIDTLEEISNVLDVDLKELFDIDYISKLQVETFYEGEIDSHLEYYKEGLDEKEAIIIENIITVMDIIAVFKEANKYSV